MSRPLKPNDTIILILFLVTLFAIFFGWYLHRTCRRIIEVQVHEMQFQKDLEAQQRGKKREGNGGGSGNARGNGSAK
jgi:hypothetical protein